MREVTETVGNGCRGPGWLRLHCKEPYSSPFLRLGRLSWSLAPWGWETIDTWAPNSGGSAGVMSGRGNSSSNETYQLAVLSTTKSAQIWYAFACSFSAIGSLNSGTQRNCSEWRIKEHFVANWMFFVEETPLRYQCSCIYGGVSSCLLSAVLQTPSPLAVPNRFACDSIR